MMDNDKEKWKRGERDGSFFSWEQSNNVFRWSGLVVGCLAMMVSSSFMAFSAYANDLKELFNVTQSDIELMAGLANMGSCAGLPAGLLLEGCGSMATSGAALIITLSSTVAMWSASHQPEAYSKLSPLLCFYMFLYGFGAVFVYLTVMTVNIRNFHHDHRAKVIAFTGAMWWMGPAVFSTIYNILFRDTKDIGGYFLLVGLSFSVISILMVICLHDISELDDEDDIPEVISPVMDKTDGQGLDGDITGLELIKKVDCHLIFWTFCLYAGLQFSFFTNMTAMLQSFRLEVLNDAATIAGPVIAFATKLFSGVLSDTLLNRIPRSLFLIMVGLPQVLVFTINITNADNGYVFMLTVVVLYAAHGVTFTIIPTMLSEYFGTKHFSSNWGTALLGYAMFGWIFLFLFGLTYDENALKLDKDDETRCYGGRCFMISLATAAAASFLACILSIILVARSVRFWGKEHVKDYEPKSKGEYESIKPLTANSESPSKSKPAEKTPLTTKTKYDTFTEVTEMTPINQPSKKPKNSKKYKNRRKQ